MKKLTDILNEVCDDNYYPDAGTTFIHPYLAPETVENKIDAYITTSEKEIEKEEPPVIAISLS